MKRIGVGLLLGLAAQGCDVPPEDGPVEPIGSALTQESAASDADLANPAITLSYASRVYGHFQSASSSAITFTITTLSSGAASSLAQPINAALAVPSYWIEHDGIGTKITNLSVVSRVAAEDEWAQSVTLSKFDELGHPVSGATYRLLSIKSTLAGVVRTHKSLELCWSNQSYCIVMDPVVLQLDAFAGDRATMQSTGWKESTVGSQAGASLAEGTTGTTAAADGVTILAVRHCTLNSHPTWGGESITWPGYSVNYKNIFGMTLVHKSMGGQQAGISCFKNSAGACRSSGFGYSNDSSCYGNLGYSCACSETGVQRGTTGATTRTWAQTKCTHKLIGSASVSWSRNGSGSGFSISWNTNGGVDSNGGSLLDACSFH